MKVLIDECAPEALKAFLAKQGHDPLTVQEAGWAGKHNGELLKLAEGHFDAFVTVDALSTRVGGAQTRGGHPCILLESFAGPPPIFPSVRLGTHKHQTR